MNTQKTMSYFHFFGHAEFQNFINFIQLDLTAEETPQLILLPNTG